MKQIYQYFLPVLAFCFSQNAFASDGFDNNYVGNDPNQLLATINSVNHSLLFGPGVFSNPGYYIHVPNNATPDLGVVSSFTLTNVFSYVRSAYFDRVLGTTFYYRIYRQDDAPGAWTAVPLDPQNVIDPDICHGSVQIQTWEKDFALNLLEGLPNGLYFFEFYTESTLKDVGDESDPCMINASLQCNNALNHPGRHLWTRYNVTDPTVCDLENVEAGQSPPSKLALQVEAALPLTWLSFSGKERSGVVELSWTTGQELDIDLFRVEKSVNGYQWKTIGQIQAQGNTAGSASYAFTDISPWRGFNYYRIVSVEYGGAMSYSNVAAVETGNVPLLARCYPNPAAEEVRVQLDAEKDAALSFRIFDAQGRQVYDGFLETREKGEAVLPLAGFPNGTYALQCRDEAGKVAGKGRFVVMR